MAADAGLGNDLAELSDEFDNSASIAQWQRVHQVEGWNADQLQVWDVDQVHSGRMVMQPHTVVWYEDWRGPMVFKEVSGDFVFTAEVAIGDRDDVGNSDADDVPGDATFSLGGLMIRTPRAISSPADWSPGSRQNDGTNSGENYVFLSLGHGTDGQFSFEVKTTRNSSSQLELTPLGQSANTATLRIARIGTAVITMYRLPGEEWIVHRRFSRPDMPETLQLGLVTYSDWNKASDFDPLVHNSTVLQSGVSDPTPNEPFNPDLVASFEFARFARPQVPDNLAGIDLINGATDQQLLGFLGDEEVVAGNAAPEIEPIADQSATVNGDPLTIELIATDADGDTLTYDVQVIGSLAAQVMAEHQLYEMSWRDDYALNWGGQNEKWLQGDQGWYFLLPDGSLNLWGGSFDASTLLAQFTQLEYNDPQRILGATDLGFDAQVIGSQLIVTPGSQTGSVDLQVTVSDGAQSDGTTFAIDVFNTVPMIDIGDQMTSSDSPLVIDLPAIDADGHVLSYSVELLGDQLAILDSEHGFWSNGNYYTNYHGLGERWIRDSSNQWHYLLPGGELYRWQGSIAASTLVASLDSSVYDEPVLLTDPGPAPANANIVGGQLIITAFEGYTGSVLVRLTASDGYASSASTFFVSVLAAGEDESLF